MAPRDLSQLALQPAGVPTHLYRVQGSSSATLFSGNIGMLAASNDLDSRDVDAALLRHLDWYNREPSPFISTFCDAEKARSWGLNLAARNPKDDVKLLTIETARMPGALVFHANSMCHALGVTDRVLLRAWQPREYLFHYEVPMYAITEVVSLTPGAQVRHVRRWLFIQRLADVTPVDDLVEIFSKLNLACTTCVDNVVASSCDELVGAVYEPCWSSENNDEEAEVPQDHDWYADDEAGFGRWECTYNDDSDEESDSSFSNPHMYSDDGW